MNKIIIGTRSSDLALWQANYIKKEIERKNKNIKVEIKLIKTKGDRILDVPLSKIGDKGLFTKELESALLNRQVDLAVHSLKDLQTEIPAGLKLAAVTKRDYVEDVLIARKKGTTIHSLREGALIATGSLRRRSQLKHIRPDVQVTELRGNVPTRIQKFINSKWDGIILARAGVERLKLTKYISSIIPTNDILPAVGQGALAIEINENNRFAEEILGTIHDEDTFSSISAERAFLKKLEGGCQIPIGAYAEVKSNGLFLDGIIGSLDGYITFRKKIRGSKHEPSKIGIRLASDLLKAGAKDILKEFFLTVYTRRLLELGKSLENKIVLLTQEKKKSIEEISSLQEKGANVILFPTIKIVPTNNDKEVVKIIKEVSNLHYIIFPSANAVEMFKRIIFRSHIKIIYKNLRVVAVGNKTKSACEEAGIPVNIVPEKFSAKGIAEELAKFKIREKNIFIPGSAISRDELQVLLKSQGANVLFVPVYDVIIPPKADLKESLKLLKNVHPDLFIFTSPSTFFNFVKIMNIQDPVKYFRLSNIAAIGPTTAAAIRELGVNVKIVPDSYTMKALVESIILYYSQSLITT